MSYIEPSRQESLLKGADFPLGEKGRVLLKREVDGTHLSLRGELDPDGQVIREVDLKLLRASDGKPVFKRTIVLKKPVALSSEAGMSMLQDVQSVEAVKVLTDSARMSPYQDMEDKYLIPISDCSAQDVERLILQYDISPHPALKRDTLTGFRTKGALLSEKEVELLSNRIGDNSIICFIDFDNMGPPNKFGLSQEVDCILSSMGALAEKYFEGLEFEVFRVGGDEFVVLLQDAGVVSEKALRDFNNAVKDLRTEFFFEDDFRLQKAEVYSVLRTLGRQWLSDYKADCRLRGQPFSILDFADYILERTEHDFILDDLKIASPGERLEIIARNIHHICNQALTDSLAGDEMHVMGISSASVRLQGRLSPIEVMLAMGKAEGVIHFNKEHPERPFCNVVDGNNAVIDVDSEHAHLQRSLIGYEIRAAEERRLSICAEREREYERAYNQFTSSDFDDNGSQELVKELLTISGADASLEGVTRANLVWDIPIEEFLTLRGEKRVHVLAVDIDGFGTLNNQLGYDRGDFLFAELVELSRTGAEFTLRLNGGSFLIVSVDAPSSSPDENELKEKIFESIRYDHRPKAEFIIRRALDTIFDLYEEGPIEFPRVQVRSYSSEISSGQTVGSFLSSIVE